MYMFVYTYKYTHTHYYVLKSLDFEGSEVTLRTLGSTLKEMQSHCKDSDLQ